MKIHSSSLKRSILEIFFVNCIFVFDSWKYLFLMRRMVCMRFYIIFHWLKEWRASVRRKGLDIAPSHLSIDFEHRGCVAEHVVPECTLENIRLTYFIQWILI